MGQTVVAGVDHRDEVSSPAAGRSAHAAVSAMSWSAASHMGAPVHSWHDQRVMGPPASRAKAVAAWIRREIAAAHWRLVVTAVGAAVLLVAAAVERSVHLAMVVGVVIALFALEPGLHVLERRLARRAAPSTTPLTSGLKPSEALDTRPGKPTGQRGLPALCRPPRAA